MPVRPKSEWLKWISAEEKARLFERALEEIEQERAKAQAYRDAADRATWELMRLRRTVSQRQKAITSETKGAIRFVEMPEVGASVGSWPPPRRFTDATRKDGDVLEVRTLVPIDPAWAPDLTATWTPIEDADPFFRPAFYAPDPEPADDAEDDPEWEDDE